MTPVPGIAMLAAALGMMACAGSAPVEAAPKAITQQNEALAAFASMAAACQMVLGAVGRGPVPLTAFNVQWVTGSAALTGGTTYDSSSYVSPDTNRYGFLEQWVKWDTTTSFAVAFDGFGPVSGTAATGNGTCWHVAEYMIECVAFCFDAHFLADSVAGTDMIVEFPYNGSRYQDQVTFGGTRPSLGDGQPLQFKGTLTTKAGLSFSIIL